jgi:hypothetical protein
VVPKSPDFIQDHLPHLLDILDDLKSEVESLWASRFVGSVVPDVQVWMLKCFFDCNSGRGVKCKHTVKKIESLWVCLREQSLEGDFRHEWQVTDIFLGSRRADAGQGILVWCTKVVQNLIELVDIVTALEERTSSEKLGENASNRPNID